MKKAELQKECESLRLENQRLLNYIAACRMWFGDCAVNQAIMELVPKPQPERPPIDWDQAIKNFKWMQSPTTPQ